MQRACEQGYLEQSFWHGRADTNLTEPVPGWTYYPRDPGYSEGIARQAEGATHEYRLRLQKALDMSRPSSTHTLADIAEGLLSLGDEQGARNLIDAFVDFGSTPAQFVQAARQGPAQELGLSSGAFRHVLGMPTSGSWEGVLRSAGYDSINTRRNMIMLTQQGQRRVTAKFDPKNINSSNLLAGTIGAAAFPATLYVSQDKE